MTPEHTVNGKNLRGNGLLCCLQGDPLGLFWVSYVYQAPFRLPWLQTWTTDHSSQEVDFDSWWCEWCQIKEIMKHHWPSLFSPVKQFKSTCLASPFEHQQKLNSQQESWKLQVTQKLRLLLPYWWGRARWPLAWFSQIISQFPCISQYSMGFRNNL